jgi:hypothetical protein
MVERLPAAACLLLFLASGLRLPAEEPATPEERTRRLLLFFELEPEANFGQEEELLLYESLLVRLSSASRKVAVKEYPSRAPGASEAQCTTLARSLGADCWLRVGLAGNWLSVDLRASSYDLIAQATAFAFERRKPMRRGAVDLQRDFWDEVSAAVDEYYSQAAANRTVPGEVVFQARPGTRIVGAGPAPLRTDSDGIARAAVQVPVTLAVRATRAGFFPVEGKYFLSREQTTVRLEQDRGARFALEAHLTNLIFPGLQFSYFLVPGLLFARTGFTTNVIGLLLTDSGDEAKTGQFGLLVSRPLNQVDLGIGVYLNDEDRDLRAYAGLGAFLRLLTTLGYVGLEPIAPWGLQAALGLEYSRNPRGRFYLELAPLLHFTSRPDMMCASFSPEYSLAGYAWLPWGVFEFLNVRLGFRWQI